MVAILLVRYILKHVKIIRCAVNWTQGVQAEETRSECFLSCRRGQAVQIKFNQSHFIIQLSTAFFVIEVQLSLKGERGAVTPLMCQ